MADLSSYYKRLEAAKAAGDWVTVGHLRELFALAKVHLEDETRVTGTNSKRLERVLELRKLIKQAQGA